MSEFLVAVWLGTVARKFYKKQLGFIMAKKPNWFAAVLFYVIFLIGLVVFVIRPAETTGEALVMGAFFGLVTYATYDLTNQATLEKWPKTVTIVDMVWGVTIAAITASVTKMVIGE
jgi:uncharacterized membrane protein